MPGLSLDVGLGARGTPTGGGASNVTNTTAQTAGQVGFGPAYPVGAMTTRDALTPNDAFGLSFWLGVVGLVGLMFIRHSLPE